MAALVYSGVVPENAFDQLYQFERSKLIENGTPESSVDKILGQFLLDERRRDLMVEEYVQRNPDQVVKPGEYALSHSSSLGDRHNKDQATRLAMVNAVMAARDRAKSMSRAQAALMTSGRAVRR